MVQLVEYPASSDEDSDLWSDDDSQWSSLNGTPSSPSDSFSCPMPSPGSDEDDDDYAPSASSSLGDASSVTSSVDTDDLDPDRMIDEQQMQPVEDDNKHDTVSGTARNEVMDQSEVFHAWTDLRAAFDDHCFQRTRAAPEIDDGLAKKANQTVKQKATLKPRAWRIRADAAPRVAIKQPQDCQRLPTVQSRLTSVSSKVSTLLTNDTTVQQDRSIDVSMKSSSRNDNCSSAMQAPDSLLPIATCAENTQALNPFEVLYPKATLSDKRHLDGSKPRPDSSANDVGVAIQKPYKFAQQEDPDVNVSKAEAPVTPAATRDDTEMTSPTTCAPSISRTSSHGEFLFGQSYKNRRALDACGLNQTDTMHTASNGATTPFSKVHESKDSMPSPLHAAAAVCFTTGVAGPRLQTRRTTCLRKQRSPRTVAQPSTSSASGASWASRFGNSPFQAASVTCDPPGTTARPPASVIGSIRAPFCAQASKLASDMPITPPIFGSNLTGTSTADPLPATNRSPFQPGPFSFAPASATPTTDASKQPQFGNGTSHHPFQFGRAAAATTTPRLQTKATASPFLAGPRVCAASSSSSTSNAFQIGCSATKQTPRARARKTGIFSHKNPSRIDAKICANEPEPSPKRPVAPLAKPARVNTHDGHRRYHKNTRLRQYGRTQPSTARAHEPRHSIAARPLAWKPPSPVADASSAQRTTSTALNQSAQAMKRSDHIARPACAGSRRILRAALRNVGVQADRTQSTSPTTVRIQSVRDDADMESDDERDWEELKRLGNVAHCARRFQDAAEYYRQSIEGLEAHVFHQPVAASTARQSDKAKLHANRAASLLMLMLLPEAQHECQRAIEVDATYASAYLRLGRIQLLLGDSDHAQANVTTAKHLMDAKSGQGNVADQADHASLIQMEAKIQQLAVLQREIKWYVDRSDYSQALLHTEKALDLAPRSRKLQVQKAQILLHQRQFDALVYFCRSLTDKHQALQRTRLPRGGQEGRDTQAKSLEAQWVATITGLGLDLGLLWATTLHYQEKEDEAMQLVTALEAVAPCSSHVIHLKRQWHAMKQLKHQGNAHFKRGAYRDAVQCYSEAVLLDPHHFAYCSVIYCNRAAAQMALQRYHTAMLDCNEALQRQPQSRRALLRRARCHVALTMYMEALKDFDRYLLAPPSDVTSDATDDDVCRERKAVKAAIAHAQQEARRQEAAKHRAQREPRSQTCPNFQWKPPPCRFDRPSSRSTDSSQHDASGAGTRSSVRAPTTSRRSHYAVLGIKKEATDDQIKRAYRKLALVYHPDKAKTSTHADLFKEMTAAYNVLSDGRARSKYDRECMANGFGTFSED